MLLQVRFATAANVEVAKVINRSNYTQFFAILFGHLTSPLVQTVQSVRTITFLVVEVVGLFFTTFIFLLEMHMLQHRTLILFSYFVLFLIVTVITTAFCKLLVRLYRVLCRIVGCFN